MSREVMILAHNVAELERRIARIERLLTSERAAPLDEILAELRGERVKRKKAPRQVMMNVAGSLCTLEVVRGPYDDDGEQVFDLKGRTGILEGIPAGSVMEVSCG